MAKIFNSIILVACLVAMLALCVEAGGYYYKDYYHKKYYYKKYYKSYGKKYYYKSYGKDYYSKPYYGYDSYGHGHGHGHKKYDDYYGYY
ncbi:hypothetical protein WR25_06074 [Diploscapter pachys]|uniref:Uncharacterized protein n=1 Tax=Diploscapter pachys TaxID=2018661 RepID=A0A2A2LNV2_9BILA|nr:hypothetical protein WR25_06074 [Diploscapter pachys]